MGLRLTNRLVRLSPQVILMCGRYASFLPAKAVARLFHTVNPLPNFAPTWNMAPTQDAMVVRHHPETGERHLDLLKWGLLPYFTKDPVIRSGRSTRVPKRWLHPAWSDQHSPAADASCPQMPSMSGSL